MLKISKETIKWNLQLIISVLVVLLLGQMATAKAIEVKKQNFNNIKAITTDERPKEIIYTVIAGDSVFKIAQKYKVHRYQLRQWNNIDTSNYIYPGQKLVVKEVNYDVVEGLASWYGPNFHGKNMANGEVYNMHDIVVAHRSLPLGRMVKVTNLENGKSIIAPVLDRGPYVKNSQGVYTREIDLSYRVAQELGTIERGVVLARVEPINEALVK